MTNALGAIDAYEKLNIAEVCPAGCFLGIDAGRTWDLSSEGGEMAGTGQI